MSVCWTCLEKTDANEKKKGHALFDHNMAYSKETARLSHKWIPSSNPNQFNNQLKIRQLTAGTVLQSRIDSWGRRWSGKAGSLRSALLFNIRRCYFEIWAPHPRSSHAHTSPSFLLSSAHACWNHFSIKPQRTCRKDVEFPRSEPHH